MAKNGPLSVSKKVLNILPGSRHRATHQASVDAILAPIGINRKVVSMGEDFVNVDNWYLRAFASGFCRWYKIAKKDSCPDYKEKLKKDLPSLVSSANLTKVHSPYISIAETPDQLPESVASALIGSAYHEAWHSKYSHRKPVSEKEMQAILFGKSSASSGVTRLNGADWGALESQLLNWMNLIEDVRIERLGCKDFIGARGRMEAIQDFVLEREAELHKEQGTDSTAVIFGSFRDIGKGYKTPLVKEALNFYKNSDIDAASLVMYGPLRKHLNAAMRLTLDDSITCFNLAMDILIELSSLSEDSNYQNKAEKDISNAMKSSEGNDSSGEEEKQEEQEDDAGGGGEKNSASDSMSSSSAENKNSKQGNKNVSAKGIKNAATNALKSGEKSPIHDVSSALKDALSKLGSKEPANGAAIYRPLTTNFDRIVRVNSGNDLDVPTLYSEVRSETSYLRTRLRNLFRATELVDVEHGLKKGKNLSNRMIAESVALLRSGISPERPYFDSSEAPDLSMSAVIVMDESSSMRPILGDSCKVLLALSESLDSIGCKLSIVGFMKNDSRELYDAIDAMSKIKGFDYGNYHRSHAMTYHIFKTFEERLQYAKPRFGSLTGNGDTPMGDGINFGISLLSPRNEGHRFIFVVTDGEPDDYGPVKNRLELAKSLGIKVIGIGLGPYSTYVKKSYPDYVWSEKISDLPPLLVRKITSIIEKSEKNRGKRVSKDETYM